MLINCPRCGFSQPKDQYCASCGVNIETYVPAKISIMKKMFSNTLIQITAVVIVTLGGSYYALRIKDSASPQISRRKSIQQTIRSSNLPALNPTRRLEKTSDETGLADSNSKASVSVELQNEEQRVRLAGASAASATRATAPSLTSKSTLEPTSTTTAAAMAAATPSLNLKFSYYEVSRTILAYWIQNNRPSLNNDPFHFGVVSKTLFDSQIRYAPLKTESTTVVLNTKTNFRSDANKDGVLIGLGTEILINNISNERATGLIAISKVTSQESDIIRTYFDLPLDHIFFLHWENDLIGLQNEAALAEVPPFQILKSRQYIVEKKTELVIVIESAN